MCIEALRIDPYSSAYVSNHFKTQEMCNKAVNHNSYMLIYVSDQYNIQKRCNEVMDKNLVGCVLELLRLTHGICIVSLITLHKRCVIYILDWFVRSQQLTLWHDGYYNDDNYDEVIGWHNGYQKRKAMKAQVE